MRFDFGSTEPTELQIRKPAHHSFICYGVSVGAADVPKRIDLYSMNWHPGKPNFTFGPLFAAGVYEIKGNQLQLNLVSGCSRNPEPRPKALSVDPHSGNVLLTLQRHRLSADEERIRGTWPRVSQIEDGEAVGEDSDRVIRGLKFAEYDVFDTSFHSDEQRVFRQWGYMLDPSKQPKTINMHADRTVSDGTRKTQDLRGIYKLEDGRLTLAYRRDGPRPEKFESAKGSQVVLLVLGTAEERPAARRKAPAGTQPGAAWRGIPESASTPDASSPKEAAGKAQGPADWPPTIEAMLLSDPVAQQELNLTDDQKARLKEAAGKGRSIWPRWARDQGRDEGQNMFAEQQKTIAGILRPDQLERLKEMSRQRRGDIALFDKDVQDALGLRDDQKKKFEAIQANSRRKMGELRSSRGNQVRITEMLAIQNEVPEAMLKVLDAEQLAKFERMKGTRHEIRDAAALPFSLRRKRRFDPGVCVRIIACSPDGKLIAVGNEGPTMFMASRTAMGSRPGMGRRKMDDNWQPAVKIFDADTGRNRIVSLDLITGEEDTVLAASELHPHFEVKALAFSPDGNVLAVGTSIGQVKLFSTRTGEWVRSLDDEKGKLAEKKAPEKWKSLRRAMRSVASLAFSTDGSMLAVCGGPFTEFSGALESAERSDRSTAGPGRVELWEVATGTLKYDLAGHSQANAVAFSPDGKLLASVGRWSSPSRSSAATILWNAQTGMMLRPS